MRILKSGLLYFTLVFGAGFVFGIVRTLWVVPFLGSRNAELLEAPLMLLVITLVVRWMGRRHLFPPSQAGRFKAGFLALGFLLTAELLFVLRLRGLSLGEYLAARDPVSGTVYLISLGFFALGPLLLARR